MIGDALFLMVISFNATAALHGTSGFVHSTQLLGAMVDLRTPHRLIAITTPTQTAFREAMPAAIEHLVLDGAPVRAFERTAWLQWRLPDLLRRHQVDVLYNKGNFHLFRNLTTQVCLIENANPFSRLSLPQPPAARIRNRLLRMMSTAALRRAAAVIFPSDTARRCVLSQVSARAQTAVIPHGWSPVESEPVDVAAHQPYLLAVSSMYPHRNLLAAVDILAQLHVRNTFRGRLLIVGGGSPTYGRWFMQQVADRGMAEHVRVIPPVASPQLMAYYRGAEAALMPSIEETFGMPLIEAMGAGVPVVAARHAGGTSECYFIPFEEIAGDAAEYFDPFDPAAGATAVEHALAPSRRQELIVRGLTRVRSYSWSNSARLTLALLEAVGGTRKAGTGMTEGGVRR